MRNNRNSIIENVILFLVAIGVFAIIGGFAGWWSDSDDEEYYDYDYSPSSSYSSHSSSSYNSSGSSGSSSYTPKSYSSGNIIVVVHQKAVQILRVAVRTAIAIPVAALHIQEVLQAAVPVQRNIIMIHMMMVMTMSIWMETMMMTDTTAMMIMLPV